MIPVDDPGILKKPMTVLTRDARAPGGIVEGAGPFLVVEDTADTHLATFRFRNASVAMLAAEQDFEIPTAAGPRRLRAGSIIIPNADRKSLAPQLEAMGLSAWALMSAPPVAVHDLDVPRIGYVHSWTRTQDEGWWRAAFDAYGIPYTYFADQK